MKRRTLNEINAGSMADIAFLLLIFFLVTTTMSTNTGMQRRLPPPPENDSSIVIIPDRNIMVVLINRNNHIAIDGKPILLKDICEKTKEFFNNSAEDENLPEKKEKTITILGKIKVTKGIVSLQTDRNTSYHKYLQVQNELVRAVNELRNELALYKFNRPFDELNKEKQDAIGDAIPLAISEAEPRRITSSNK